MLLKEMFASVALSHDEACKCLVCRAAKGDREAVDRLMVMWCEREGRAA